MNYLTDVVAERSPLTPRSMQPSSAWSQRNRALRIHPAAARRNNLSQLLNNEMAHAITLTEKAISIRGCSCLSAVVQYPG